MTRVLAVLLAVAASPAAANQFCDDLWFTRNEIINRAGYCFSSPLGRAMFDNSDCTGTNISLSPENDQKVSEIQELERRNGCQVDTSATSMWLPDLGIKRQLVDMPVPDEFESACFGWRGTELPLLDRANARGEVIGAVAQGDAISFAYIPMGAWTFVQTYTHVPGQGFGALKAGGWTTGPFRETDCAMWAG